MRSYSNISKYFNVCFEHYNATWQTILCFLYSASSRINVALSGTAIQSSTYPQGNAEHAIDGNTDPVLTHSSCANTYYQDKPWWRLQLPGVYRVSEIEVTNRMTRRFRLNDVEIFIGNSMENNGNNNPRWISLWYLLLFHCRFGTPSM